MIADLDGYHDGYGIGLAGGHNRPLVTMKDASRWSKRYSMRTRRRFARGFAVGAFRGLLFERGEDWSRE